MDLVMPGMGWGRGDAIGETGRPRTQVIVLTSYHQDEHIFPAIRAGALSYLLKDVEPRELADAVPQSGSRRSGAASRVASRVVQELHGARREGPIPSPS